jgi:ubiquinone/menaquinone biosynthesis C-methylase UbiE
MSETVSQDALDAGRGYEGLFVPAIFAPWTKHLIEGAGVTAGSRVLDIACGSGVLARHALATAGETGRVVGIDPAPGMIAAAKEIEPQIDWVLGSAEDLRLDDAAFDCVVSQFGMMFFQDRRRSVEEMHRVIAPGGSLAIAVWNSIDHNPAYGDIIAVLDEQVSTAAGDALRLPYTMGDAQEVTTLLEKSGFTDIKVETKTEQARFPSSRTMVEAELRGWLPLFDIYLSEEKIADVLVNSDSKLSKYASLSGEAVFPTSAHIFTARKP